MSGHVVHELTFCFRLVAGKTEEKRETGLFKDSISEVNKQARLSRLRNYIVRSI